MGNEIQKSDLDLFQINYGKELILFHICFHAQDAFRRGEIEKEEKKEGEGERKIKGEERGPGEDKVSSC